MIPLRLRILLWLAALALFFAVAVYPVSNLLTRVAGVILALVVRLGLLGLCWKQRVARWTLLALTAAAAVFLGLPSRALPAAEILRADYVHALKRYDRIPYVWGGESIKGIDCSGLIRRGLIDSLFLGGVRALDHGRVRHALALWWQDSTAKALGVGTGGKTVPVLEAPSINQIDHRQLQPGDLAVTTTGTHILAYLGEQTWIQADPGESRVVTLVVPEKDNIWFRAPVRVMRWAVLTRCPLTPKFLRRNLLARRLGGHGARILNNRRRGLCDFARASRSAGTSVFGLNR